MIRKFFAVAVTLTSMAQAATPHTSAECQQKAQEDYQACLEIARESIEDGDRGANKAAYEEGLKLRDGDCKKLLDKDQEKCSTLKKK